MTYHRIAVLGAGSWGTALAQAAQRASRDVILWGRNPDTIGAITKTRINPLLPGIELDEKVGVTTIMRDVANADVLLIAVPAQASREVCITLSAYLTTQKPVIACAKGIERGTKKFMTDVIAESIPGAIPAILSGPGFASDVANGLPTAVTLAASDEGVASDLAHALGSATFRPYHSTDTRGVEIGGAAKNVLAIAAGIVSGRKLGASAAAALTTRGFAELVRFGRACGAQPETLMGLSGLGDLFLTCSNPQSRNFSLGIALGQGQALTRAQTGTKLAEGFFTASVLVDMAGEKNVEMPIASAVAAVLSGRISIDEAVEMLLTRPFKSEL